MECIDPIICGSGSERFTWNGGGGSFREERIAAPVSLIGKASRVVLAVLLGFRFPRQYRSIMRDDIGQIIAVVDHEELPNIAIITTTSGRFDIQMKLSGAAAR